MSNLIIEDGYEPISLEANGAQLTFTFDWPIFDTFDLVVSVDGVACVLTGAPATYTEFNATRATIPTEGGSITFGAPPPLGSTVLISRSIPIQRSIDLPSTGPYSSDDIDYEFDRVFALLQWAKEAFTRTILLPIGEVFSGFLPGGDGVVVIEDGSPVLVPIEDFAQGPPGEPGAPGANVTSIGLFVTASALTIPVGTDLVHTSGYAVAGRGHAIYVADVAVDAAYVAAHPRLGFVTVNGRGFRLSREQRINVMMFGAAGDDATDDLAAFNAALDGVKMLGWIESANYRRVPELHIPLIQVAYYLSDTWDLLDATYHIIGEGGGGVQNGGLPVRIRIAAGKTGIRIQAWNTTGETSRPPGVGAQGTIVENLFLYTAGGGALADGFRIRATSKLVNCTAYNFSRHGINLSASAGSGGAGEGNANLFQVRGGHFYRNGECGIFLDGADANAGVIDGSNCSYNGTWGIWDDSFLGNLISGCHADENGVVADSGPSYAPTTKTSLCHYAGNRYAVILGQEVGASANAPSGTNLDNAWWRFIMAGGVHTIYPTWFAGITTQSGGAYRAGDANSRTMFLGCYSEASQAPSVLAPAAMAIGGLHGAGLIGGLLTALNAGFISTGPIGSRTDAVGETSIQVIGGPVVGTAMVLEQFGRGPVGSTEWRRKINAAQDWYYDYAHFAGALPFQVTGPGTAFTGGRTAPEPYMLNVPNLFLGSAPDARCVTYAAAAPVAGGHATGEIVFNTAPVAGGKVGWVCTTAGTPGTWKAFGPIDP
jgi:hypothetical protein